MPAEPSSVEGMHYYIRYAGDRCQWEDYLDCFCSSMHYTQNQQNCGPEKIVTRLEHCACIVASLFVIYVFVLLHVFMHPNPVTTSLLQLVQCTI